MSYHLPTTGGVAVDMLFAQICRATPEEARNISKALPMPERAVMALACNARTHLRAQGRAIASACTLTSLVTEGGQAGLMLFNQIEATADTWGAPLREGKRRVSLAG